MRAQLGGSLGRVRVRVTNMLCRQKFDESAVRVSVNVRVRLRVRVRLGVSYRKKMLIKQKLTVVVIVYVIVQLKQSNCDSLRLVF